MAQKLKDEVRQAIITAAKEEFLERGYEDASMRSIAQKAGITVGNIYRYFDNKDDLNRQILAQTSDDIKDLLRSFRIDSLSKQPRVFDMSLDNQDLNELMNRFTDSMVDLYFRKRSEFNIILCNEDLNGRIRKWFSDSFGTLIYQKYSYADQRQMREYLSSAYSEAVFAGMKDIFMKGIEDEKTLRLILKNFLSHFITMVNENKANGNLY
ncbi:MAG: TetR/AcrR family transcriptional regulator [Erysipelotrichaceae bacterium]|nr:TetR/AcrR family transcriptional regulator [Erysipelotrichaceae bacterium]